MRLIGSNTAPHKRLSQDHRAIDALLEMVVESAQCNDQPGLSRSWTDFERRLSAHLEGEERTLLAPLASSHPTAIRELSEQHGEIRRLVAELGLQTDCHALRLEKLEKLGKLLRAHEQREDETLYLWAERELGIGRINHFFRLVKERLSSWGEEGRAAQ